MVAPKKPLDLSNFDTPEPDVQARIPEESFHWQKFAGRIKGMLVGDEYEYAEDTLRGILKTVEARQHITEGQERAVDNIEAKPHRDNAARHGQRRF